MNNLGTINKPKDFFNLGGVAALDFTNMPRRVIHQASGNWFTIIIQTMNGVTGPEIPPAFDNTSSQQTFAIGYNGPAGPLIKPQKALRPQGISDPVLTAVHLFTTGQKKGANSLAGKQPLQNIRHPA